MIVAHQQQNTPTISAKVLRKLFECLNPFPTFLDDIVPEAEECKG